MKLLQFIILLFGLITAEIVCAATNQLSLRFDGLELDYYTSSDLVVCTPSKPDLSAAVAEKMRESGVAVPLSNAIILVDRSELGNRGTNDIVSGEVAGILIEVLVGGDAEFAKTLFCQDRFKVIREGCTVYRLPVKDSLLYAIPFGDILIRVTAKTQFVHRRAANGDLLSTGYDADIGFLLNHIDKKMEALARSAENRVSPSQ